MLPFQMHVLNKIALFTTTDYPPEEYGAIIEAGSYKKLSVSNSGIIFLNENV